MLTSKTIVKWLILAAWFSLIPKTKTEGDYSCLKLYIYFYIKTVEIDIPRG